MTQDSDNKFFEYTERKKYHIHDKFYSEDISRRIIIRINLWGKIGSFFNYVCDLIDKIVTIINGHTKYQIIVINY